MTATITRPDLLAAQGQTGKTLLAPSVDQARARIAACWSCGAKKSASRPGPQVTITIRDLGTGTPIMAGGTKAPSAGMTAMTIRQGALVGAEQTGRTLQVLEVVQERPRIDTGAAGKNIQTACKPGSVPPCGFSSHSSATRIAARLVRHTRGVG